MTKLKVLIPTHELKKDLPDHLPEFKQFQKDFDVHIKQYDSAEELKTDLQTTFNDISAILDSGASFRLGGFNQFIEHFPPSLKVVSFPWVGANHFDHEALRAKGIDLANVGDVPSSDVADIALGLTLSAFRYTSYFERSLRNANGNITEARKAIGSQKYDEKGVPIPHEGDQNWSKNLVIAGNQLESPKGKIAGIVGLGAIGKEIAKRLNAIGLKIRYTKRTPISEEEAKELPFDVEYYPSFKELIPEVDLIVLAVPHTAETVDLINEDTLKLVKRGVRIVNIGRGSAINEDALFKALDEGIVNSIGLDVFLNEPQIDERFLNRPNVALTPHLGSFTVDNFRESAIITFNNIRNVLLNGGKGVNILN